MRGVTVFHDRENDRIGLGVPSAFCFGWDWRREVNCSVELRGDQRLRSANQRENQRNRRRTGGRAGLLAARSPVFLGVLRGDLPHRRPRALRLRLLLSRVRDERDDST